MKHVYVNNVCERCGQTPCEHPDYPHHFEDMMFGRTVDCLSDEQLAEMKIYNDYHAKQVADFGKNVIDKGLAHIYGVERKPEETNDEFLTRIIATQESRTLPHTGN